MEPTAIAAYVMPIGRFKGKALAEIAATDRRYLEWAARTLEKPRMREVITYFLSTLEPDPVEASS